MFDENQLITTKWNPKTKSYYESKGYNYTGIGTELYVKAKDLKPVSRERIKITCDFCGKEVYPMMTDYNRRKTKDLDSCDECKTAKTHFITMLEERKEKFKLLREICNQNDYILLTDESEYTKLKMDIEYICKKHGKQSQQLQVLLRGGICRACAYEKFAKNQSFTPEYVKSIINSINGNKLLNPEDYINSKTINLRIKCGLCGNEFICSLYSYVKNNQTRCQVCSKKESSSEFIIRKFLESNNILFIKQKKFLDCKDKFPLPFDFYLPDYNLCIEFDGQQHYEPRFGNEEFEVTKKHDEMKNQYCKEHNINLLRIPYWEGHNIEEIISKQLNL